MASPGKAPERLLAVEEARRLALAPLRPLPAEVVPLAAALGRVLAAPVHARDPAPPFDTSEMDGYAVRLTDIEGASERRPAALTVRFEVHAGQVPPAGAQVSAGEACWIATGAMVPDGADVVVPREWTREPAATSASTKTRRVEVLGAPAGRGAFVRPKGDDWQAGEEVLGAGDLLTPARVALAASCGAGELRVHRRPRVAILATGDELLQPGSALRPGTIRESNRLLLAGLTREAGGEPEVFPIVPDDREATSRAIARALEAADLVLTTGGVSAGERDFVRDALADLGMELAREGERVEDVIAAGGGVLAVFGVAVKPGKPLAVAVRAGPAGTAPTVLFALPGNPASALVSFHLFVGPALRVLSGRRDVEPVALEAALEGEVKASPDRRTYARARLRSTRDGLVARVGRRQASGSVRALAESNALVVVEAGDKPAPGARVRVEPLGLPHAEGAT